MPDIGSAKSRRMGHFSIGRNTASASKSTSGAAPQLEHHLHQNEGNLDHGQTRYPANEEVAPEPKHVAGWRPIDLSEWWDVYVPIRGNVYLAVRRQPLDMVACRHHLEVECLRPLQRYT